MTTSVTKMNREVVCELKGLRPEDTVLDVKAKIEALTSYSAKSMYLGINGKFTRDKDAICSFGWKDGDAIVMAAKSGPGNVLAKEPQATKVAAPRKTSKQRARKKRTALKLKSAADVRAVCDGTSKPLHDPRPLCVSDAEDLPPSVQIIEEEELGSPSKAEQTCGYTLTKSEYGYVQIPSYRSEQRDRMKALEKRQWVPLPLGTQVQNSCDNRHGAAVAQKRVSCLKRPNKDLAELDGTPRSTASETSDGSVATSNSENRRVRFGPPCARADPSEDVDDDEENDDDAACAEVFYIHRDDCGISLFESIPMDPIHWRFDYTNSDYAREFLEALSNLESLNKQEQRKVATCRTSYERYIVEEQELDEALRMAGVGQELLKTKNQIAQGVVAVV